MHTFFNMRGEYQLTKAYIAHDQHDRRLGLVYTDRNGNTLHGSRGYDAGVGDFTTDLLQSVVREKVVPAEVSSEQDLINLRLI